MITTLFAMAPSSFETIDALAPVNNSFGVGKAFAVLVVVAAFLLGAMFLGGHLGEASRRRRENRHNKRH